MSFDMAESIQNVAVIQHCLSQSLAMLPVTLALIQLNTHQWQVDLTRPVATVTRES